MTGAGQPHTGGQRVWKLWPCGCTFATRDEFVGGHVCRPAPSAGMCEPTGHDAPCRYCGGTEGRHTVMCPHAPPPASSQPRPDRGQLRAEIVNALLNAPPEWDEDDLADLLLDVLAPHLDALDRARNLLRVWETVAQPQRQGTFAHALRRALDGDGA